MNLLETERLNIRKLSVQDAPFILELLNDPSFILNIADRGVRTLTDAELYVLNGPAKMYQDYGFGLFLVELSGDKTPIGMCGLIKRDDLPDVDIGFAFLPQYWSKGYALEASKAVIKYGKETLHMDKIVAIVNANNESSIKLLEKLGLTFEKMIKLGHHQTEVKLYS